MPQQQPVPSVQSLIPPVYPTQPGQVPPLNWSYFKPEFAGKPGEDTGAHLLKTKDWIDTHGFPERI